MSSSNHSIFVKVAADVGKATSALDDFASSAKADLEILKAQFLSASREVQQAAKRIEDAERQAADAVRSGNSSFAQSLQEVASKERAVMNELISNRERIASTAAELKQKMADAMAPPGAHPFDEFVPAFSRATEAIKAEGEAIDHTVPSWIAASSAAMTFEGRIPIRAFERFVSQTLGLGPILQAAFPVFGAVALTGVLISMAEEVMKTADNFLHLKDAEQEVIKVGQALAKQAEEDIEQISRLGVEALRESGHLVEAAHQQLQDTASKPIYLPKLDDKKLKELDTTQFQDQLKKLKDAYGEVIPADLPDRIKQVNNNMAELRGEIGTIEAHGHSWMDVLDTHYLSQDKVALEAYEELLQRLQIAQQKYAAEQTKNAADVTRAAEQEKQKRDELARKAMEQAHQTATAAESEIQSQISILQAVTRVTAAQAEARAEAKARQDEAQTQNIENPYQRAIALAQEEVKAAQDKADAIYAIESLAHQREMDLIQKRRAVAEKDPKGKRDVARIDAEMAQKQAEYTEKLVRAQTEFNRAKANYTKTQAEEQRRLEDEIERGAEQMDAKVRKSLEDQARVALEVGNIQEEAARKHSEDLLKIQDVYYQGARAVGLISGDEMLRLKQKQYDAEYQQTLKALEKERAALAQTYAKDTPEYKRGVAQLDTKQQSAKDTYDLNSANNELKQMELVVGRIKQTLDPLGRNFSQAMTQVITNGGRFDQVMAGAARNVLASWATMLIQMGVQWAERHAIMFALHEAWQLGITAVDYSQQATRAAGTAVADKVNATIQIESAAGVAAANTFASISAIPIVGPELAPAAAAAAFSEVMAFNVVSAERGAVLPNSNSLAFLHPNEMVLPAHLSKGIQNFVSGGNSSNNSRSTTVNGGINYNGRSSMGGSEFRKLASSTIRNLNQ